jgi:transposase
MGGVPDHQSIFDLSADILCYAASADWRGPVRAYSQDLRDRVLNALERGERPTDIAQRYEVSRGWVHQVRKQLQSEGRRTSLQIGGHRVSVLAPLEAVLCAWIADQPDWTLAEMCERLTREHGVVIGIPALWHQLDKWGLSFKKKLRTPASKNGKT